MKKRTTALILVVILAAVLAGCGSGSSGADDNAPISSYGEAKNAAVPQTDTLAASNTAGNDAEAAGSETAAEAGTVTDSKPAALNADKIVYTADISMSTKEFDKAVKQLKAITKKYGAIVQSENYSEGDTDWYTNGNGTRNAGSRSYYVSLRVPSKNYNTMLDATGSMNAVTDSRNSNAENISQQYSDTQAQISSLKAELVQLNGIMQKATKVQDILDIQQRITEVQTQLDQAQSDMDRMDTDVAYSYVNVTLNEVAEYSDKPDSSDISFGRKIINNFVKSLADFAEFCRNLVLFLALNWIKIVILAAVVFIIVRIRRTVRKKKKEKPKKPENTEYKGYQGKPDFSKPAEKEDDKDVKK